MLRRSIFALFFLLVLTKTPGFAITPSVDPPPASGARMVKDLVYLASDELEGRGVGTRGLDLAADYIAERFESLGLRTLPNCPDYFQPFNVTSSIAVKNTTSLRTDQNNFELTRQFMPQGFSAEADFNGPVAFVGYGVTNSHQNYDDYAGIDVKGKIVIVLRYEPHNEKGTSRFSEDDWSPAAALTAKAEAAAANGATALLLVNPPKYHGLDVLMPLSRAAGSSKIPFIHVKQDVANALLRRSGNGKTIGQLQDEIDATGRPQSFVLNGVNLTGKVELERKKVPVKNVVAVLPGGKSPDEYVIVGAHYDHLGHGGAGSLARGSELIHNGADDNASGTVAVLNMAERMVYAGRRDRSVIFVLFTGEEEGLLGSQHFVSNPPVPLNKIVAMLNLDMVGRVRNDTLYVGGSGTAVAFDAMLNAADQASPLQIKSIGKGGRGPSDQQSFSMKRIPVLFFFSGMHSDYHTPTDDAMKVNYGGINEVVKLGMNIVTSMSTMPRQEYVATFDSEPALLGRGTGSRGTRVSLGVVPDYGTDESTGGVRITGTSPGSPAEAAGLKDGDVIVQIAAKKIDNLYDLTNYLNGAQPGDKVTIVVMRKTERVELSATLAERKG